MCAVTQYPESIPLCRITSSSVIKSQTKFFSSFSLPCVIQTDQGTNFQTRLFKQVLKELSIKHAVSSAYLKSQCFQTLASDVKVYAGKVIKKEGIHFILYAAQESTQESLGFSPAELVFGHVHSEPLKVLKERILESNASPEENVLVCVCQFCERLHCSWAFAKKSLCASQTSMKRCSDTSAISRHCSPCSMTNPIDFPTLLEMMFSHCAQPLNKLHDWQILKCWKCCLHSLYM